MAYIRWKYVAYLDVPLRRCFFGILLRSGADTKSEFTSGRRITRVIAERTQRPTFRREKFRFFRHALIEFLLESNRRRIAGQQHNTRGTKSLHRFLLNHSATKSGSVQKTNREMNANPINKLTPMKKDRKVRVVD